MSWSVRYLPDVEKDMRSLSPTQQRTVRKAILKVKENPLPQSEGGYGKPLGNKQGMNLTGFLKIKLRGEGLRVVYQLIRKDGHMLAVVVGVREDEEVYQIARKRKEKYRL